MPWPDYMDRETLAQRLDLKPGAVDQYVKRGLLPQPVSIGEAVRWSWRDVENHLRGGTPSAAPSNSDDPYMAGVKNGHNHNQPAAARSS